MLAFPLPQALRVKDGHVPAIALSDTLTEPTSYRLGGGPFGHTLTGG